MLVWLEGSHPTGLTEGPRALTDAGAVARLGTVSCFTRSAGRQSFVHTFMLLHCTSTLAAKLSQDAFAVAPLGESGEDRRLGSWHGHLLLLDRRHCVMFCHDLTRYVLFLPGLRAPHFADLGRWHRELFLAVLATQGISLGRLAQVEMALGPLMVDRRTDRSVLASLRVAANDLQCGSLPRVSNVLDLDPIDTARHLNQRPCWVRKQLVWPEQAMRSLVELVAGPSGGDSSFGQHRGHA